MIQKKEKRDEVYVGGVENRPFAVIFDAFYFTIVPSCFSTPCSLLNTSPSFLFSFVLYYDVKLHIDDGFSSFRHILFVNLFSR